MLFFMPQENIANLWFSDGFKQYRKRVLAQNRLNHSIPGFHKVYGSRYSGMDSRMDQVKFVEDSV